MTFRRRVFTRLLVSATLLVVASMARATPGQVIGLDYGPFRDGQRPGGPCPSQQQVAEDLQILTSALGLLNSVRSYGVLDCDLGEKILVATRTAGLTLALGTWLSADRATNRTEIEGLRRLASTTGLSGVLGIVVGSEVLLRGDLPMAELIQAIQEVRTIVPGIPVATVEPWHIWLGLDGRYPNPTPLIEAVDVIAVNVHPYWEGVCIGQAVDFVFDRVGRVQIAHPGKLVAVSETGWPTSGESRGCAVPSLLNQSRFLVEFVCRAITGPNRLHFYLFSAFDERWKAALGLEVEAHWGLSNPDRTPKHDFAALGPCPPAPGT